MNIKRCFSGEARGDHLPQCGSTVQHKASEMFLLENGMHDFINIYDAFPFYKVYEICKCYNSSMLVITSISVITAAFYFCSALFCQRPPK